MKVYQYRDYDHYKEKQIAANRQKINRVWCSKCTVEHLRKIYPDAKTILCHGARNGTEVRWFKELYPDAEVIGTDISPTANDYDDMVEWDFNEVKEEWIGKFDLIYSNSFDHTYDPKKCLETWTGQVSENGVLCVELMVDDNNKSTEMDPLQINQHEFIMLLEELSFSKEALFYVTARNDSRVITSRRR